MSVPCGGRFSTLFAKNRQIGRLLDSPTHTNEREFISLLQGVLFGNSEIPNKIPCLLHGFSLMDKQLLLTEMRLTRCRLMTYIVNAVLCWQHFSRLVPAVPGLERWAWEHTFRPSCVQWLRMIRNFLKLLKTHQSQLLLEL